MAATLTPEPVTPEGLAPFGRLLRPADGGLAANLGTARRHDWLADLVNERAGARLNVVHFVCAARVLPLDVDLIEHHPHSTQLFVPMAATPFLVVVEGAAGPRAFRVEGEAIAYAPGVWHAPMIALDRPLAFTMLVHEDGGPEDTIVRRLPAPWRIGG